MLNSYFKLTASPSEDNQRKWNIGKLDYCTIEQKRPQICRQSIPKSVLRMSNIEQRNEDTHKLSFTPSKLFWMPVGLMKTHYWLKMMWNLLGSQSSCVTLCVYYYSLYS